LHAQLIGGNEIMSKTRIPTLTRRDNYFVILNFDMLWKYESDIIESFTHDNQKIFFGLSYGSYERIKKSTNRRNVIESNDWIEPWWKPDVIPNSIWISTSNKKEIEEIISLDEFFTCAILNDKTELLDYSYVISNCEDDVGNTLFIFAHNEYEFKKVIIPKFLYITNLLKIDIYE
jgi:hypothetical protein